MQAGRDPWGATSSLCPQVILEPRDDRKGGCLQTGAFQVPCSDEVSPGKTATQGVTITVPQVWGTHPPTRKKGCYQGHPRSAL